MDINIRVYFRLYDYSVISLPSSVIYFGGRNGNEAVDRVVEYKNQEWKLLGNLVSPREDHSSIKMGSTIFIFGGYDGNDYPT